MILIDSSACMINCVCVELFSLNRYIILLLYALYLPVPGLHRDVYRRMVRSSVSDALHALCMTYGDSITVIRVIIFVAYLSVTCLSCPIEGGEAFPFSSPYRCAEFSSSACLAVLLGGFYLLVMAAMRSNIVCECCSQ